MTLTISVTDFISKEAELIPIVKMQIDSDRDTTVPLLSDNANKASAQCERFERLAKEIDSLIKSFYREGAIDTIAKKGGAK